jgi:hypothetical protein
MALRYIHKVAFLGSFSVRLRLPHCGKFHGNGSYPMRSVNAEPNGIIKLSKMALL